MDARVAASWLKHWCLVLAQACLGAHTSGLWSVLKPCAPVSSLKGS